MNAVQEIMSEMIDYGGIAARRGDAYLHAHQRALERGADRISADRCGDFACMSSRHPALSPEQSAKLIPWDEAKRLSLV